MLLRLGFRTGLKPKQVGEKRIWIHALSVGEVISSLPFVKALKEQYKDLDIVFTASTKTGFDMAMQLFLKTDNPLVDQMGYFPYDLGWSVKKISRTLNPDAVVIVETDLWPNFLYEMKKKKTPVILINARLSKQSLKGYLFFKKFSSMFFSSLELIMVQTALDKKRFQRIGINLDKILVTGNIKFDQPVEDMDKKMIESLKDRFGMQKKNQVIVAGSTHEGEEKLIGKVYKKLKKNFPGLKLILAPRNPKRCSQILSYFLSNDIDTVLMSAIDDLKDCPDLILVDQMGELCSMYAICNVAFIGGSMVRQGGHNPLEPASFSKPIIFGEDMSDFLLISTWLLDHGGAKRVKSEKDLTKVLGTLLGDRQLQKNMGAKNFEIFSRNSGAVKKIIRNMELFHIV
ncbi:MAG: 3-deoxy-D-manno-octulosonic acid transferase [Desulfobacula sp.]|uniref:3-deoxy-D-manno-octulosonic acid transferase n=1 Tax=Desulfobacula sp. TaxID=2593537 RepID=UPI001D45FAC7|nr:3-deoxy-D-manno-octulosonic acid transferase [Desulfobacula sp.]MBT3484490.1 3-deoxy-D-manno-octulosonic acid transferase [Desulfobacula sp.]MBT3803128.1 3-deoxy-D-manno-octulosonic acid transferase [Desulfobacula sp.]MBT4024698.1 3-deoxy-D-manno-octulosonic acid transferase [Desulfobacula sp.]MBT4197176.1 3-deoxy-D-manno-octulosonic acid transferase [Desulfobacula sp.]